MTLEHQQNTLYWYWLAKKEEIGNATIQKLLDVFGCIEAIYDAKQSELESLSFLHKDKIPVLLGGREKEKLSSEIEMMQKQGIRFITREQSEYPVRLSNIYDAPWFLFVKGKLPKEGLPSLAIIGARNCSFYGKEVSYSLSRELAKQNVQIISGFAKGIDGHAHRGAIDGGGNTYGILGNGIDLCYPMEHWKLYDEILLQGGLISEYSLGTQALPFHFPRRNRIISGLSDGILVVEAMERSGTLITVEYGLDQGKDIYALPGRIDDKLSYGCNQLIQQGAKLVLTVDDILKELPGSLKTILNQVPHKEFQDDAERTLWNSLSMEPKHVEQLMQDTKMTLAELLPYLFQMELKSEILQVSNQYYIKRYV